MISFTICVALVVSLAVYGSSFEFTSSPAMDLQPYFEEQPSGWLGADVATSIKLIDYGDNETTYLWLFGDTLVGKMINVNGTMQRKIAMMPRNSIGLMNVSNGEIQTPLSHYWNYDPDNIYHGGFFTPVNESTWFWVTTGIVIDNDLYLFAFEVYMTSGTGMFNFAFMGTTLIHVHNIYDDPSSWAYNQTHIPNTSDSLTLCTAVTVVDNYLYIFGELEQEYTVLARITIEDLQANQLDNIEWWSTYVVGKTWATLYFDSQLVSLFPMPQPEATVFYHDYMQLWYMLVLDPFTSKVSIRTTKELTGVWSDEQLLYNIPAPWGQDPFFCYAIKSHPELQQHDNEIIFSFMSNGDLKYLPTYTEIYIPQIIRVKIQ